MAFRLIEGQKLRLVQQKENVSDFADYRVNTHVAQLTMGLHHDQLIMGPSSRSQNYIYYPKLPNIISLNSLSEIYSKHEFKPTNGQFIYHKTYFII